MILMIDNYDSFTYNLVQYMGELGADIRVERNNCISIDEIESLVPKKIVISPGPCTPAKALAGVQGPGDITIFFGTKDSISSIEIQLLRSTRISAPNSPMY